MGAEEGEVIVVGRIAGLYGVRGWVRVHSYTEPKENILDYSPWRLRLQGAWVSLKPAAARAHGKGLVVRFEGCEDRDSAARLLNAEVAIRRDQLPPLAEGEFYWTDLVGLAVETLAGVPLGVVAGLMETGANDVLVVKGERERLIPFLFGSVVAAVDREAGKIRVDWDPEF